MESNRNNLPPAMDAPRISEGSDSDTAMNGLLQEVIARRKERLAMEEPGKQALMRLFEVAQRDTGQSRRVAAFLLGCYSGTRFPFDLTDFRGLDYELFDDCMTVLRMDSQPLQEVHRYFENGGKRFEEMAQRHGIRDVSKMEMDLKELRCRKTGKVKSDPLIYKGFFSNLVSDQVPCDTDHEKSRNPCQEK